MSVKSVVGIATIASVRVAAEFPVVAQDKVIADLETLRGVAQAGAVVLANELRDNNDLTRTWQTEVDADLDLINDYLASLGEQDGVTGGDYTIGASSGAATFLGAGRVEYRIGGEKYHVDLDTTIVLTGTTSITGSNWRAWRVVIDRLGVVTTESPDNAGQADEEKALLELGSIAQAANTVEIAVVTGMDASAFIPATTDTDVLDNLNPYYLRQPKNNATALFAGQGSILEAGAGLQTLDVGLTSPKVNGLRLATIGADSTLALTDADTIAAGEAGAVLLLTDLAGTGFLTLASDGVPGISALTDTDAAGALAALNLLASRLPALFVPIGYVIVVNASGGTFTFGGTDWDATDMSTTVLDQTAGAHDRTVAAASFLARKSNPPTLPDTVTAPVVPAAVGSAASVTAVDDPTDMTAATINA